MILFLRKEKFNYRNTFQGSAFLEKIVILTGDSVTNAQSSFDENGRPQVNISLDIEEEGQCKKLPMEILVDD